MKYTEVNITLSQLEPYRDLLIDALGNEGPYDSFVETPDGLKAYVPTDQYDPQWLKNQLEELSQLSTLVVSQSERGVNPFTLPSQRNVNEVNSQFSIQELPDKDWNEEWEKQHQPVLVEAGNGKRIWVRAPFHEHRANVDYEIEIEPKMSFGTAHHPTTYMMLSYLAELPMEGLRVLDMGCGTAILAILASMRGAEQVEAIDIDEWAYRNALENIDRNHCKNIHCALGDASYLKGVHGSTPIQFDLVIANINRNILLRDMEAYVSVLSHRQPGGIILFSGFYTADIPALAAKAESLGLILANTRERDGWAAIEVRSKS
ncbi:MAG: 50S ribosomal protein L11 methyltransferase [Bacteroidales bacterium]|nr:50S ribosomal protein L11 methyltransferase [Bacteroidales bacterium]